jgi:hypothetical protein
MCSFVLRTPSYLILPLKSSLRRIERRLLKTVDAKSLKKESGKFLKSKRALAIPVTYLILFVSLMAVISATYSFAVVKISSRGALIKATVAEQNMRFLDDAVHSVAWSFGASQIVYMDDCGGVFKTEITAKNLALNLTDERSFSDVVFNSRVGRAYYELENSEFSDSELFMRGDERAIINQTAFTMTQLYVVTGNSPGIVLSYRPLATVSVIGTSAGKPLNLIRMQVININSSDNLILQEKFYLKAESKNVTVTNNHYEFNQSINSLELKATIDGNESAVWLPISSNIDGAVVDLETVVSNISIQSVEA